MTGAKPSPKLPWWVTWHITHDTTRQSLRHDAWFYLLLSAGALVVCGGTAFHGQWRQAAWAGVLPAAALGALGLWTVAAVSWLDRNQAWARVAARPPHPRGARVGGGVALLFGLLLLALSGWRFWIGFLGSDESLLWSSRPFLQESAQLAQEHNARVKDIKARQAMKEEYAGELQRYEAAEEELRLRQEAEMRAAAPRWRWLAFGTARSC
jgi:hypothetical protein